ncbi:hypothetical protein ES708_34430 [subsurface metagenome]
MVLLGAENLPHKEKEEDDNNRGVPAYPAYAHVEKAAADKDRDSGNGYQRHAEPSRHTVNGAGHPEQGAVAVGDIEQGQVEEVKGIGAKEIADG